MQLPNTPDYITTPAESSLSLLKLWVTVSDVSLRCTALRSSCLSLASSRASLATPWAFSSSSSMSSASDSPTMACEVCPVSPHADSYMPSLDFGLQPVALFFLQRCSFCISNIFCNGMTTCLQPSTTHSLLCATWHQSLEHLLQTLGWESFCKCFIRKQPKIMKAHLRSVLLKATPGFFSVVFFFSPKLEVLIDLAQTWNCTMS